MWSLLVMESWVWECSLLALRSFLGLLTPLSSPLLDYASLASPAVWSSYLCFRTWLNQQRRSTQKWTEIACIITSRGSLSLVKDSEVHLDQSWDLSSRILSASALLSISSLAPSLHLWQSTSFSVADPLSSVAILLNCCHTQNLPNHSWAALRKWQIKLQSSTIPLRHPQCPSMSPQRLWALGLDRPLL